MNLIIDNNGYDGQAYCMQDFIDSYDKQINRLTLEHGRVQYVHNPTQQQLDTVDKLL